MCAQAARRYTIHNSSGGSGGVLLAALVALGIPFTSTASTMPSSGAEEEYVTATTDVGFSNVSFQCNVHIGLESPLPLCNESIAPITQCTLDGPYQECGAALAKLCPRTGGGTVQQCDACVGSSQAALRRANCSAAQAQAWCSRGDASFTGNARAEVVTIAGINGISRPFCRITPSAVRKVPLVIFFHGASGNADQILNRTNLLEAARTWTWPGGASGEGFVLAVPSAACLSWPRLGSKSTYHWDFYHRDLASPSSNPDVALADAIIDAEVARGTVDRNRVFIMGWSNGGFFGQMYAIARSAGRSTPTPGGNFVAAASVYTAADPFNNLNYDTHPSCQLQPYPRTVGARLMITSNNCDLVPCDGQQAFELDSKLRQNTSLFESPGFDVDKWVRNSASTIGSAIRWDLLDALNQDRLSLRGCNHGRICTPTVATVAHSTWPHSRLADMLHFLGGSTAELS